MSHSQIMMDDQERQPQTPRTPQSSVGGLRTRDWNGVAGMEDPDGVFARVAQYIEQLRSATSPVNEKEHALRQLYELADGRKDARSAVGSHSQAVPLLVALLRSGTLTAKVNAAAILGVLCKEGDLRIKVLLGGCIPPLLALLKSTSPDAQIVAAKALNAVSQGGARDHVGSKIFSTEDVVASLWEQLHPKYKLQKSVGGLLTGALRNLCTSTEGFWSATLKAGAVDILVGLLVNGSSETQGNAASLLASLMGSVEETSKLVLGAKAMGPLLQLLTHKDVSVRAEAAGALRALSCHLEDAQESMRAAGAIVKLISATVAPSKEFMQGEFAQALQENSMGTLSNILGGMPAVVVRLAESIKSKQSEAEVADTTGALAYALMVLDGAEESVDSVNPAKIEQVLVKQLEPHTSQLVRECSVEALASLYGNACLAKGLEHAEAKRMLVGLVTMANVEPQEELMRSLRDLCSVKPDLWKALRGRDGVQLLISLLGLSSEQQQEYAAALLSILSQEIDESKWAITAAGGIPPLVQLLETGSAKAKEDSAIVLGNLCSHSEDIRACVETAEAVPALLWLLKNGGSKGQEIAARALTQLVLESDASTISQLSALLTGDLPESKVHVLHVVGCLLTVASQEDTSQEGSAANEALQTVVQLLESKNSESQEHAASVLAGIFASRQDLCESPAIMDAIFPLITLLNVGNEQIAMQAARALAALFCCIEKNRKAAEAGKHAILPLISLAKSSSIAVAEFAMTALANLLLDTEVAEEAPAEEIILPLTRVLREGTLLGKEHAAGALVRLLHSRPVDDVVAENVHQCGTVLALVALLANTDLEHSANSESLEALASLARAKRGGTLSRPPWAVLVEVPFSMGPLVNCLAVGVPFLQEKAIEVLSRLCRDQPVVLGDLIAGTSKCIAALADRIIHSSSLEVKVGGTALLICAAKEHRQVSMEALYEAGSTSDLIQSLVDMLGFKPVVDTYLGNCENEGEGGSSTRKENAMEGDDVEGFSEHDPAAILGCTVALWLLCVISSHDRQSKVAVMEAGAIEVLTEKLAIFAPNARQAEVEDNGSTWVSALLLAILFQDRDVTRAPATMRAIPSLATLLKSQEAIDRYFAAQALASLVCNGSRGTLLAVANSGAAGGLIPMLGSLESDMSNLVALSEEFALPHNPDQVALERLFRVDDIRVGATARKAIPALVDLLKPLPDRPGAPPLALGLLTQVAEGNNMNKLAMAEAGALDGLTKYLSIGPQDAIEEATADLLRILFSSAELRHHDSAVGAVEQLVAVLRFGTRGSRLSAARALHGLFAAEHIKVGYAAGQAVSPLVEMMSSGVEKEQRAAIGALIKLSLDNPPKVLAIADSEANALEGLCRVLLSDCSLELKEDAAELCQILFSNPRVRSNPAATCCIPPLVALLDAESSSAQYAGACALDNLLEDELQAEAVAANGAVLPLVNLMVGSNFMLHEAAVSGLIKLAKDRPLCKLDMVKAGVIDTVLEILPVAPDSLCALTAELLRILTNNSSIAKGAAAAKVVEPLFSTLTRPDLSSSGQHSAMQVLVNILEKPQRLANLNLTPSQAIEPLVLLLDSPAQPVQQLAAELLSHLLAQEHFQRDVFTQQAVVPLVRLVGVGVPSLQKEAIRALESASNSWPNAIVDAGGIEELSALILQVDPPPHALWEAAALVLSNVLRFSSQYFLRVPVAVLVRLLRSSNEATVVVALTALLVLERDDASSAEGMAETGAIEALLELLRCHQCEEAAARLLEALFNNVKVRDTRVAKLAIAPLAQYLLDPQTCTQPARLLAALALGDLFQLEGLSRSSDAVSACRALVSLLEDQPNEEMKMVAVCALHNLVLNSRANKRAVAEAGGIQVVQELLSSSNSETAGHAATLLKLVFSTHTIQEYASSDIIRALAAVLEKDLWATASVNEDVVKAITIMLGNFGRLRATDEATQSIPQLVGALKAGNEPAQEAALDALYLLQEAWSSSPAEVGKAQAMAAAEAIPVLQLLMREGPPHFQEKADCLLQCLPGSLVVTVKQGHNLKLSMGSTNAFCKITLGNGPPRQTKVVNHSTSPEWKQGFAWAFDTPPKGQKLHITCKSKSAFGKGSLGKVTIQIDRVVMEGTVSGQYTLQPDTNRDGSPRSLEVEFQWSNR